MKIDLRYGDGVAALGLLRDVAFVIADLPSGETRATCDVLDLPSLWESVDKALNPDGVVVCFASSLRFAATVVASQPTWFRYELIWEKGRASGFLNAKRRPLRAHEYAWRSQ